ncbi:LAMI_0G07734g1_1 [Lachancea mirantina]|uniref:LAMI_0G07734g1_1 n=1 Tax=Lachancea mirantina TaxID=1230905 RepID=A0A1G4K9N3_9SACH|nr:LAMI_0G07734g1_1 [Lachancea mirantina]
MGSSHRLGEKKAYSYQGRNSGRHEAYGRAGPGVQGAGRGSGAVSDARTGGTGVPGARRSRYDPVSGSGPHPALQSPAHTAQPSQAPYRATSRYNPETGHTWAGGHASMAVPRTSSEGHISGMRWGSSRYNPQSSHVNGGVAFSDVFTKRKSSTASSATSVEGRDGRDASDYHNVRDSFGGRRRARRDWRDWRDQQPGPAPYQQLHQQADPAPYQQPHQHDHPHSSHQRSPMPHSPTHSTSSTPRDTRYREGPFTASEELPVFSNGAKLSNAHRASIPSPKSHTIAALKPESTGEDSPRETLQPEATKEIPESSDLPKTPAPVTDSVLATKESPETPDTAQENLVSSKISAPLMDRMPVAKESNAEILKPKLEDPDDSEIRISAAAKASPEEPCSKIESCIFPLTCTEMRLWELKNRRRANRIKHQKYLLAVPIKSLQDYPFVAPNFVLHNQATRSILTKALSQEKRAVYIRKLKMRQEVIHLKKEWKLKCEKMDFVSAEVKRKEQEEQQRLQEAARQSETENIENQPSPQPNQQNQQQEPQSHQQAEQQRAGSRRRNRGDFVDDAEIENVLLQIDPDYRHHQLAAKIPDMHLNPYDRFSYKFQDVNNLVTDKASWAKRVSTDGIDTFSDVEHALFIEGFLSHPKKFGKISQHMGGLRTPQECVLHYYKTKKATDYKQLILEKKKKRKLSMGRRRKDREKGKDRQGETDSNIVERGTRESTELSLEDAERTLDETEDEGRPPFKTADQEPEVVEEAVKQEPLILADSSAATGLDAGRRDLQQEDERISGAAQEPLEIIDTEFKKRKLQEIEEVTNDIPNLQPIAPAGVFVEERDRNVSRDSSMGGSSTALSDREKHAKKKLKPSESHQKSSYWSVKETSVFPELLKEFGTQWALISKKIGTKSTTMVRNYYQRNAIQMGWQNIVEEVNVNRPPCQQDFVNQQTTSMAENVPAQQKPYVSFFAESDSTSISTPTHTSVCLRGETFSQQSTPQGLPPPRLPTITFRAGPDINELMNQSKDSQPALTTILSSRAPDAQHPPAVHFPLNVVTAQHPSSGSCSPGTSSQAAPSSRRSSIKSLLNADDQVHEPQPALYPQPDTQAANVIVQELQPTSFPTSATPSPSTNNGPHKKLNPLSSILNTTTPEAPNNPPHIHHRTAGNADTAGAAGTAGPADARVLRTPVLHENSTTTGITTASTHNPLNQKMIGFNFANNPLAALAAVASAPEALTTFFLNLHQSIPTSLNRRRPRQSTNPTESHK